MPPLTFNEAREVIAAKMAEWVSRLPAETVPLDAGGGRVLAAAVTADRDYPPFHRSTRDGYAVRAGDVAKTPTRLRVVGETRAGEASGFEIGPGETVEIMTGAPGPKGADAVVMLEYARRDGDFVTLESGVPAGKNLIFQGSEARAGSVVLEAGNRLDYPEIALLAATGHAKIHVYRQPEVAILTTGDEVLDATATPEPFQIRNSNAYSMAAQVRREGAVPQVLPNAPDDLERTRQLIEQGLESEMLLLSGGVSKGKYDYVKEVLTELGAEFCFTQVAIQPGKPLVFGQVKGKPFFGLPGNPISTMVTFEIFARLALHILCGRSDSPLYFVHAKLGGDFQHKPVLTRFLPATLEWNHGEATVNPVKWQGSGDLVAAARSNCYLVATPDRASWKAGEWVAVLPR